MGIFILSPHCLFFYTELYFFLYKVAVWNEPLT